MHAQCPTLYSPALPFFAQEASDISLPALQAVSSCPAFSGRHRERGIVDLRAMIMKPDNIRRINQMRTRTHRHWCQKPAIENDRLLLIPRPRDSSESKRKMQESFFLPIRVLQILIFFVNHVPFSLLGRRCFLTHK